MKKIFLMAIIALIGFSGCATDKAYEVGKSVYIGGKSVVKANDDLIRKSTMDTLKNVDRVAVGYNTIRTEVRTDLKKKIVDTNSTKIK
ncbi:hypothetical protein [Sulfurimonas sp.]|uniref:hypothetical protein n=1 Tax=Sulfurimonas sp. TaxID=2022749 RepID=UPI0025D95890|nr:hypothetical protein [Sulfurimonas sp.]